MSGQEGRQLTPSLGHSTLADQLVARIDRHFAPSAARSGAHLMVEQSLVIGVFGEWGAGKSTLLGEIGARYRGRVYPTTPSSLSLVNVTIPVEFNPWRYEREPELIVPLLHTIEKAVSRASEHFEKMAPAPTPDTPVASKVVKALGAVSRFAAIAGLSLASSVKVRADLPGFGAVELSPKDAIAEAKGLLDAPVRKATNGKASQRRQLATEMSSVYYDFQRRLAEITGRESAQAGDPQINLLILVDDIDRCLPEKAVEMLETAKLFLDVPGCAFVLAIDDEVVERGILHRYRDYLFAQRVHQEPTREHGSTQGGLAESRHQHSTAPPITGTEYLEKIIHLPVRLPMPTERELKELLRHRYPEVFVPREEAGSGGSSAGDAAQAPERRQGGRDSSSSRKGEAERLLDLFVTAVPPVPRKLVRAVDLFLLLRDVAAARGWTSLAPLMLARAVIVQLFAPDIFRYGRRQPTVFATLQRYWTNHRDAWDLPGFWLAPSTEKPGSASTDLMTAQAGRVRALIDEPLLHQLRAQHASRSGFLVQRLFSERWPIAPADLENPARYFALFEEILETPPTAPDEARPFAQIDRRVEFVDLLTSDRKDAQQTAFSMIVGSWIPDDVLSAIVQRAIELDNSWTADRSRWSCLRAPGWLEAVADHVSPDQLRRFYRETKLLQRLGQEARP